MDNNDCDELTTSIEEKSQNMLLTKKIKINRRLYEVRKKIRAMSYITGDDCNCKRLQCFKNISPAQKANCVKQFNLLACYDKQNAHLSGLITVHDVERRRSRQNYNLSHQNSYSYKIRIKCDSVVSDIPVCHTAFLSLHGITNRRLITLKKALATTGQAHIENRGRKKGQSNNISDETMKKVHEQIQSLKGRKAHYSLHESKKIYLPEELNVKKLHAMYTEINPQNKISYESYRKIFVSNYNISFGYPRTDTCSTCDQFKADLSEVEAKIAIQKVDSSKKGLIRDKNKMISASMDHKKTAKNFYDLKKIARIKSQKNPTVSAICMDYQKNLQLPNISTNDVYYRRQLVS